jgi:hypothetical protein
MQHYRTKPTVVQAIQLTDINSEEVYNFLNSDEDENPVIDINYEVSFGHRFSRRVRINEWVIKDPEGNFSVLTNNMFLKTYESINSSI